MVRLMSGEKKRPVGQSEDAECGRRGHGETGGRERGDGREEQQDVGSSGSRAVVSQPTPQVILQI